MVQVIVALVEVMPPAATLEKTAAAVKQAQADYDKVANAPNIGMLPQSLKLQQATIDYEQAKANYDSLASTADSDSTVITRQGTDGRGDVVGIS